MIIYDGSNKPLMQIKALEQEGDDMILKGKIFGAVPMVARLTPQEARAFVKLLTPQLIWFFITFLFRGIGRKGDQI